MDSAIQQALNTDHAVIDITTIGRKSHQPRRIEIWFYNVNGNIYITGKPPKKRNWYANMTANPEFTFHLKNGVQADIPARATPITDEAARKSFFVRILHDSNRSDQLDEWMRHSPLVQVELFPEE